MYKRQLHSIIDTDRFLYMKQTTGPHGIFVPFLGLGKCIVCNTCACSKHIFRHLGVLRQTKRCYGSHEIRGKTSRVGVPSCGTLTSIEHQRGQTPMIPSQSQRPRLGKKCKWHSEILSVVPQSENWLKVFKSIIVSHFTTTKQHTCRAYATKYYDSEQRLTFPDSQ